MPRVAPLLLSLALLLGGCITSSNEPVEQPGAAVEPAAAADDGAQAPPADAGTAAPANASSPAPAANETSQAPVNETTEDVPAPAEPRTVEVAGKGSVTLLVGTPCDAPTPAPPPCDVGAEAEPVELALKDKDPATALLMVTWTATSGATETLSFNVTSPEGAPLGAGEGTSPLLVSLPADLLQGLGSVVVNVVPPTPGAVASQEYDLLLTLTYPA